MKNVVPCLTIYYFCLKNKCAMIQVLNDESFDIKNNSELSSINDEEQPLCDLKVKVLDKILEKTCQEKCCLLIEIPMPKQFSDEVKLFDHQENDMK